MRLVAADEALDLAREWEEMQELKAEDLPYFVTLWKCWVLKVVWGVSAASSLFGERGGGGDPETRGQKGACHA